MLTPGRAGVVLPPARGGRQRDHPQRHRPRPRWPSPSTRTSGCAGRPTSTASPPTAVEEIVRWATPVIHFRRTVTQDGVRIGDRELSTRATRSCSGTRSANRDAAVFDEPVPVRHRPHAERPRRLRRPRPALLPRRPPGPAGDHRDVPRAVPARARHPGGRRARSAAVELHQRDQAPPRRVDARRRSAEPIHRQSRQITTARRHRSSEPSVAEHLDDLVGREPVPDPEQQVVGPSRGRPRRPSRGRARTGCRPGVIRMSHSPSASVACRWIVPVAPSSRSAGMRGANRSRSSSMPSTASVGVDGAAGRRPSGGRPSPAPCDAGRTCPAAGRPMSARCRRRPCASRPVEQLRDASLVDQSGSSSPSGGRSTAPNRTRSLGADGQLGSHPRVDAGDVREQLRAIPTRA